MWLHSCDSWLYEVIWKSHLYSNELFHSHTLDLILLICQKDALKVGQKLKSIQRDMDHYPMVSMVTLWQWRSNGRMERNRQRKREVLWNMIVNGRGTLWHLKYDRPRQRRTFCNVMWLLLSVSSHWQVHWEGFLIQFPYSVTWPIQHTPMSPMTGFEVSSKQRLQDIQYSVWKQSLHTDKKCQTDIWVDQLSSWFLA